MTIARKSILSALVAVMLIATLVACIAFTNTATVFAGGTRKIPVYSVAVEGKKVIALTFDAAWGADKTRGIIDILNRYNAKGTFFLVGFWIDKYPDEVQAIADSGLDIGNHSENHLNMPRLSANERLEEIKSVNQKVYDLTGKTPTYFRAPYGDYDNGLMTTIEELNMVGVQWSVDSLDWKGLSARQIVDRVVPKAKSGDIVLFHNNSDHILDALPIVIEGLIAKGFEFVTLTQLVATDNFTVDSNGVQHTNN